MRAVATGRGLDRRRSATRDREQPEVHGERDEVLLGPVVDVALDPSPALLRRQHESLPRRPQVVGPQLRLGDGRAQGVAQDHGLQDGRDVLGDVPEECAVPGEMPTPAGMATRSRPSGFAARTSGVTWAVSLPSRTASAGQPATSGGPDVPVVADLDRHRPEPLPHVPGRTTEHLGQVVGGHGATGEADQPVPRGHRQTRRSRLPSGSMVTAATAAASTVSAGPAPVDTPRKARPARTAAR